ncbi:hypothetical protein [Micromonospora sp. NPDC005367]|uniref:hypothetical protein n=1 Tax=Micromonospora sp. NPDC005367 TaxID=3155590 RepID=UPI0033A58C1B
MDQPAGTPKTDALEDALKAFLDPDTAGRGSIGWIFGDSSEAPAGIGTVAMLIASPATPHAHRSVLIQSLVHAVRTAEAHPEPIHTYLAAHRGFVYRLVDLVGVMISPPDQRPASNHVALTAEEPSQSPPVIPSDLL